MSKALGSLEAPLQSKNPEKTQFLLVPVCIAFVGHFVWVTLCRSHCMGHIVKGHGRRARQVLRGSTAKQESWKTNAFFAGVSVYCIFYACCIFLGFILCISRLFKRTSLELSFPFLPYSFSWTQKWWELLRATIARAQWSKSGFLYQKATFSPLCRAILKKNFVKYLSNLHADWQFFGNVLAFFWQFWAIFWHYPDPEILH